MFYDGYRLGGLARKLVRKQGRDSLASWLGAAPPDAAAGEARSEASVMVCILSLSLSHTHTHTHTHTHAAEPAVENIFWRTHSTVVRTHPIMFQRIL